MYFYINLCGLKELCRKSHDQLIKDLGDTYTDYYSCEHNSGLNTLIF